MQLMRVCLLLCCLCFGIAVHAAALAGEFSEETDKDRYDCILTLIPAKTLGKSSAARVTLEWNATKGYTQVQVTRDAITINSVSGTKRIAMGKTNSKVNPGTPYHLTIMRRGSQLGLLLDGKLIFRGIVPHAHGNTAGILVDKGWTVEESRTQPLEPVIFTDDFMRSKDEPGPWKTQSGHWALQSAWDNIPHGNAKAFANTSYAQNPFAWLGVANGTGTAICTAGESFWEDYTMSAAIRPAKDGAVGALVNMPDAKSGILVRWTPVNDNSNDSAALTVSRMINGKATRLATSPGGYIPGQWYKLTIVSTLDGVRVLIDDKERATVTDAQYWRGGVGLYMEGNNPCTFDDVNVTGRTLNTDLLLETAQSQINQRFQEDNNGMRVWSDTRSDWIAAAGIPNQYLYRRDVFGDHEWMVMTLRPTPLSTGELWMVLNSDGKNATTGYRAVTKLTENPAKITYTIYRNDEALASKTVDPLPANVDYTFRFWRLGSKLMLEVDDEPVIEATDKAPLTGLRPTYRANGCFANARNVIVLSHNMLDYTFTSAPTDWLAAGTWMPTIRWSCSPNWSFLAGWSRGEASMWHKERFTGDQSFEAFLGIKMEYPREREIYPNRYRDFCITICGDGKNPRTGYSGLFAPGSDNAKTITLLRDGKVVATQQLPQNMVPNQGANHRSWFDLELQKSGNTVTFQVKVNGQSTSVNYVDATPIDGGIPAIWTTDNGISISRARICFAQPPTPRTDPQVVLDDPWYPEWGNANQPMVLDFPESWSSTGKRISLNSMSKTAPAGDEDAVKPAGTRITFTPKQTGDHLYQITGTDGENRSSEFYLNLPVFDPALGRDDSHALVLYRFDEGKGDVVDDQSKIGPKADLTIRGANWLPIQGLKLNEGSSMQTKNSLGADKLLALGKNKAFSIEFWISTDTIYPPSPSAMNWVSCMLSLDLPGSTNPNQRSLSIGQTVTNLLVVPGGGPFRRDGNVQFWGFRTCLQHIVITWDGNTTRVYTNAYQVQERKMNWPNEFTPGNLLILGNTADGKYPYLGTFYLFAIHDRCLTSDEVRRHYNAGPSAR